MKPKSRDQIVIERRRGWILKLLNDWRPDPMELAVLSNTLDAKNYPMGRLTLARELDYLRSLKLVRLFMVGQTEELSEVDQALLAQRYASAEGDSELRMDVCARITVAGINFQDGLSDYDGITRVE
jgi:hypothetical protein